MRTSVLGPAVVVLAGLATTGCALDASVEVDPPTAVAEQPAGDPEAVDGTAAEPATDPAGYERIDGPAFSIAIPPSWKQLPTGDAIELLEDVELPSSITPDMLEALDLVAIAPIDETFTDNVNVIADSARGADLEELIDLTSQGLEAVGAEVATVTQVTTASGPVQRIGYTLDAPGSGSVSGTQFVYLIDDQVYFLTVTSTDGSAEFIDAIGTSLLAR